MNYLKIRPLEGANINELIDEIKRNPVFHKFRLTLFDEASNLSQEKIEQILIEKGQSSILKHEGSLEFFLPKGTPQAEIVSIIQRYLDKVQIDNELIIVDPYFFPTRYPPNYSSFVISILAPYLPTIDTIRIITGVRFDVTIKNQIQADLLAQKPAINIIHTQSDDYHDRYWISNNREKGIILGTSLNGLGNKYALIDRLNTSDIRNIVSELSAGGLL